MVNQTIWLDEDDPKIIKIIDQRYLPHQLVTAKLTSVEVAASAIREMWVRGAPLIGVTAAFGMYLACLEAASLPNPEKFLRDSTDLLFNTRPTAVNLQWALSRMNKVISGFTDAKQRSAIAFAEALKIKSEDIEVCRLIGHWGKSLIRKVAEAKGEQPVNILTHCNAGWLACVEWGTATSPIYQAQKEGINLHVWVDETRPRNQGSRLTAWELGRAGIPFTIITDNAGGHLMQKRMVDLCLVGTDRTTYTGDVANKIGTYLKALAAFDNGIPFYVALPSSTIDWTISDGVTGIPVEEREQNEVLSVKGWMGDQLCEVKVTPEGSIAANYGFDITPARLITRLITENGICEASEKGISGLFKKGTTE